MQDSDVCDSTCRRQFILTSVTMLRQIAGMKLRHRFYGADSAIQQNCSTNMVIDIMNVVIII